MQACSSWPTCRIQRLQDFRRPRPDGCWTSVEANFRAARWTFFAPPKKTAAVKGHVKVLPTLAVQPGEDLLAAPGRKPLVRFEAAPPSELTIDVYAARARRRGAVGRALAHPRRVARARAADADLCSPAKLGSARPRSCRPRRRPSRRAVRRSSTIGCARTRSSSAPSARSRCSRSCASARRSRRPRRRIAAAAESRARRNRVRPAVQGDAPALWALRGAHRAAAARGARVRVRGPRQLGRGGRRRRGGRDERERALPERRSVFRARARSKLARGRARRRTERVLAGARMHEIIAKSRSVLFKEESRFRRRFSSASGSNTRRDARVAQAHVPQHAPTLVRDVAHGRQGRT